MSDSLTRLRNDGEGYTRPESPGQRRLDAHLLKRGEQIVHVHGLLQKERADRPAPIVLFDPGDIDYGPKGMGEAELASNNPAANQSGQADVGEKPINAPLRVSE